MDILLKDSGKIMFCCQGMVYQTICSMNCLALGNEDFLFH